MDKIYKHYKGDFYRLLYVGHHTETEEKMVVYTKLYSSNGEIWIRPYDMFFGEIEIDGKTLQRFERVHL